MTRILPKNGPPTHPGEILLHEYLEPLGLSQTDLAAKMRVSVQRVNQIIRGRRGVSAQTAVLLGRVLDSDPWFWMELQAQYDLWIAQKELDEALELPSPSKSWTGYFTALFGSPASSAELATATFNNLKTLIAPSLPAAVQCPVVVYVNDSKSVLKLPHQQAFHSGVANA